MALNIEKITEYVQEILVDAKIPTYFAKDFVVRSLTRKKRFLDMDWDDMGRMKIPYEVTIQTIKDDNPWFPVLLKELGYSEKHLAVIGKEVWLYKKGNAIKLQSAISKDRDKLFLRGKGWYYHHTDYQNWQPGVNWYDQKTGKNSPTPPIESFLCTLGDILNLKREGYISINPGDFLRASFSPKYATFTSCHNLGLGGYRHGPVNYAMDSVHIVTFTAAPNDPILKMTGRSIMAISENGTTVGQRRFYPSIHQFGLGRAKDVREKIHKQLDPNRDVTKLYNSPFTVSETNNGYLDQVEIFTSTQANNPKELDKITLCPDIYCFWCGTIHQVRGLVCNHPHCTPVQKLIAEDVKAKKEIVPHPEHYQSKVKTAPTSAQSIDDLIREILDLNHAGQGVER